MSKDLVKLLLKLQHENPNNTSYSTETYIAALLAAANLLAKEIQP